MRFPYHVWVIAVPEGGHCPFLIRPTRAECIANFNEWHQTLKWPEARRKGWRCVRLAVQPARKERP